VGPADGHSPLPAVTSTDESVLAFIGVDGQTPDAVAERFPGFDMTRLFRSHLVLEVVVHHGLETEAHIHRDQRYLIEGRRYVLTLRGAQALGLLQ